MPRSGPITAAADPRRAAALAFGVTGLALAAALLVLPFERGLPTAIGLGVYIAFVVVGLGRIPAYHRHRRFGHGNLVTVLRAGGVALLAAAAMQPSLLSGRAAWAGVGATVALLALDGIDGWAARRQRLTSRFGARFDMEVDALMLLALAALAHGLGKAGAWVLGIGLLRYAFVVAGWAMPALARRLPPSRRRQAACVLAIVSLGVMLAPPVVPPWSQALGAAGLALLAWSFAIDVRWLFRHTP